MWTHQSHLLSYLKSEFWLKIKDTELVGIDKLITKKMDKHTKKKALVFSTAEVEQFLRTGPMTESGKCNKHIMLFSIFLLGHMKGRTLIYRIDVKQMVEELRGSTGGKGHDTGCVQPGPRGWLIME
eukprot:m51a1_g11915 hypothetical protein (126) ;mRNA; r:651326-651911